VPQLPNVPTLTELAYQGLEAAVVYGLLAPAGTPAPILSRLNAEVNRALQSNELRTGLTRIGAVPRGGTGEAFSTFLEAERARWGEAVRASGARVD
jgi:tripartite-type tricarboxylate transporter receptor subunit TctC